MQSEENCPRMCQGIKEGEKGGPGKADRQEVARVAERKPKGNEFLGGHGKMSETSESNPSVPSGTSRMRAEKGTVGLGNVVPLTEVSLGRKT